MHSSGEVRHEESSVEAGVTRPNLFVTDVDGTLLTRDYELRIVEPVFKMLAISDPDRIDDLETLRLLLPATLEGVYSHANYLEVMVRGISKGKSLADFCAARGIDRCSVVATGDSDNDVSIFCTAGHSAAMADSSVAARSAAQWRVSSDSPPRWLRSHYASSLWRIPAPPAGTDPGAEHDTQEKESTHAR